MMRALGKGFLLQHKGLERQSRWKTIKKRLVVDKGFLGNLVGVRRIPEPPTLYTMQMRYLAALHRRVSSADGEEFMEYPDPVNGENSGSRSFACFEQLRIKVRPVKFAFCRHLTAVLQEKRPPPFGVSLKPRSAG